MRRAALFLAGWAAGVLTCYVAAYAAVIRWLTRGAG